MTELGEGDTVNTHMGTTVIDRYDCAENRVYKVTLTDKTTVKVSPDQGFVVRIEKQMYELPATDLKEGMELMTLSGFVPIKEARPLKAKEMVYSITLTDVHDMYANGILLKDSYGSSETV